MSADTFGLMIDVEFLSNDVRCGWFASVLVPTGPRKFDRVLVGSSPNLSVLVRDMEGLGVITHNGIQYDILGVMLSDLARLLLGHDPEAYVEWNGEPVAEVMVD